MAFNQATPRRSNSRAPPPPAPQGSETAAAESNTVDTEDLMRFSQPQPLILDASDSVMTYDDEGPRQPQGEMSSDDDAYSFCNREILKHLHQTAPMAPPMAVAASAGATSAPARLASAAHDTEHSQPGLFQAVYNGHGREEE